MLMSQIMSPSHIEQHYQYVEQGGSASWTYRFFES